MLQETVVQTLKIVRSDNRVKVFSPYSLLMLYLISYKRISLVGRRHILYFALFQPYLVEVILRGICYCCNALL